MNSLDFLQAIAGYTRNAPSDGSSSAERPIRLAAIDPAYDGFSSPFPAGIPAARVTFEGEGTLSGKYYPIAVGVIPHPGQRVFLVPVGTTYLIAGAVSEAEAQGFYAGASVGVEFGEGNSFDTLEGLVLQTDADIAGSLLIGDAVDVDTMRLVSNEKVISGNNASGTNTTTSYADFPAPSSMSFTKKYSGTFTKLIVHLKASIRLTAGAAPRQARIGVNISGGSGDHDVDHFEIPATNVHYPMVGYRELTGFAAGAYTITARYRSLAAGTTLAVDGNDYLSMLVKEVSV